MKFFNLFFYLLININTFLFIETKAGFYWLRYRFDKLYNIYLYIFKFLSNLSFFQYF